MKELEYLCVDEFIMSLVDARALKAAFELRLIDHLQTAGQSTPKELQTALGFDGAGIQLLLDLLAANHVVEARDGAVTLSARFLTALRYRDLLEVKLDFAHVAALDFIEGFTALIDDPVRFVRTAGIFDLFGYHRCFERTPENSELTKRWMRITTALTRYEARACLRHHDFGRYARMLDIGGNSGEFALEICKAHASVQATVVDLPVVCDLGREHLRQEPEAARITFVEANALEDRLPEGFDVVTFKSMLHDWPDELARRLIGRARASLTPGGTAVIFERGPLPTGGPTLPYSKIPLLLFFRSFRSPLVYKDHLEGAGFHDVEIRQIDLETPFSLVTARR